MSATWQLVVKNDPKMGRIDTGTRAAAQSDRQLQLTAVVEPFDAKSEIPVDDYADRPMKET